MQVVGRIRGLRRRIFPERQLLLRTDGHVRYLKLGSWTQIGACCVVFATAGWLAYSTIAMFRKDEVIAHREARIAAIADAYDSLSRNLISVHERYGSIAGALQAKQRLLTGALWQRADLEEQLGTVRDALAAAETARDQALRERQMLHSQVSSLRSELRLTEGHRGELASDVGALSSELQLALHERDRERMRRQSLANALMSLRQRLDGIEVVRHSLEQSLYSRDQMLAQFVRERDTALQSERRLTGMLNELRNQLHGTRSAQSIVEAALSDQEKRVKLLRQERDKAEAAKEVLSNKVVNLENRLSDLENDQNEMLDRIRAHTDTSIKALEAVVSLTGLKLESLLDRAGSETPGIGGPLLTQKPDTASATDARDASADGNFSGVETQLGRWAAMNEILARLPIVAPVDDYRLSSRFGKRTDPFTGRRAFHSGLDFAAARRTPVLSTSPGKVVFVGWKGAYGRLVEIDHGFGITTRYGHLSRILVKKGQRVDYRDKIGLMGSTGRSTGVHVHYEVLFDGKPLDPENFLKAGQYVFKQQG